MKRFLALLMVLIIHQAKAQNYLLHAEYRSDWYGPGYPMTEDIPGFRSVTLQAQSEADQFVIESDNSFNKWRKFNETDLNVPAPFVFYAGISITDNFLSDSTVLGSYYTTRLRHTGYASNEAIVMETDSVPVTFPNVLNQAPSGNVIGSGIPVSVLASLSSLPSPQEKIYLRYTTDNWQSSSLIQMSISTAPPYTAQAQIPGQGAGTTVNYYVLSSTVDSASINHFNADLVTLRREVNGGSNYSYSTNNPVPVDSALVVFQVNISNAPFSPVNGVFLSGSFNGFSTTSHPMTSLGNGIYADTLLLDTATVVQYKFVINNGGAQFELVPIACGQSDGNGNINRELAVPEDSLTVLQAVCFSGCSACMQQNIQAVFTVNMSQTTVNPGGVFLAGDWNGFSATANPLTPVGNGLYTDTVLLMNGSTVQYKFVNGSTFENVPAACGQTGGGGFINRSLTVTSDTTLDVVCFGECSDCIVPATVPVVFRVDMSQQNVNPSGVHLAGSFNGWSASANPMLPIGNGVYADTVLLDTTQTIEYKFINGNNFANEEVVPAGCGISNGLGGFNRVLSVPEVATTLPILCFGQCTSCPLPAQIPVVFRVNMGQQTVAGGVYLGGSFNGFNELLNPMTPLGNNLYTDTILIDTNSTITYRFYNGTAGELVPMACSAINAPFAVREFTTGTNPAVLPFVCYNSCSNCPTPVLVPIVFLVNMSQEVINPAGVHLAGSFNGWSPTANPMTALGNGLFADTVLLDTNAVIQYKYLNGNSFSTEENVPFSCGMANGVGTFDRVLTVPNVPASLSIVCFGECTNCILPSPVNVTFRVNLGSNAVSPSGVHLAGTFNNWNPASTPMINISSNIWVATVLIDSASVVQYKFVNGLNGQDYEAIPQACGVAGPGGFLNRQLIVPEQDTTLGIVCFSDCSDCLAPVFVNVVFRVNMSQEFVTPAGVFLAGTFNNFSPGSPMTSLGNGIYADTLSLDTTQVVQYKFVNGQGSTALYETVSPLCGAVGGGGFINRQLAVPGTDVVLPVVCFNECLDCVVPVLVDVVLTVDLSGQIVSPAGVHLSGTFNNWSSTANPMSPLGNGLFTDTLSLDTALSIEYKFLNGNTFFGQETVPQSCGVNDGFGGYNRVLEVPEADSSLSIVCFSSCSACVPLSLEEIPASGHTIWPNPNTGQFRLSGLKEGSQIELYSYTGKLVHFEQVFVNGETEIRVEHLPAGSYILRILERGGSEPKRMPLIIQ